MISATQPRSPLAAAMQRQLLLLYGLIALPLVIYGAVRTLESNSNSPLEWVPPSFSARHDYDLFHATFGPSDTVLASWEGCTLDQPRLDQLCRILRGAKVFHDPRGVATVHGSVCGY